MLRKHIWGIVFKKYGCYLTYILLALILGETLLPNLNEDEAFTFSLIKHSYSSIINLDVMDVHPPFYYLFLKFFINVFTFWTKSIIIKIIIGHIFSLLIFLVTFYVLVKILDMLDVYPKLTFIFLAYCIMPNIVYYSIDMRMYQLSALFIACEIYGVLNFLKYNKYINIIIIFMSMTLNLYTNYFASMFGGLFLFIEIIDLIYHQNRKAWLLMGSGVLSLISFMPCLHFTLRQIGYVSSDNYSNFVGTNRFSALFQSPSLLIGHSVNIFGLLILISLILLYLKSNYSLRNIIWKLYLSVFIGFILMMIYSFIYHPIIQMRYSFPILSIVYFLLCPCLVKEIFSDKIFNNIICCILVLLLLLSMSKVIVNNNINFYRNNLRILRMMNKFTYSHNRDIKLYDSKEAKDTINMTFYSSYLPFNNKKIIYTKYFIPKYTLGSNNYKLMNGVYSNIKAKK